MSLTIDLSPDFEARLREEAQSAGLSLEQLATQRLTEAELLWRIRTTAPEPETRQLHRLLRRQKRGTLTPVEAQQLQTLLDERELRGAQRLHDLLLLARLRSVPVPRLMEQLGLQPIATP